MPDLQLIIVPDRDDPQGAEVLVDGRVGDRRYRFLLDTGASQSQIAFDEYTASFPRIDSVASSGVFGHASRDAIVVPSLVAGPIRAERFTLVRSPKGAAGGRSLIGMDLLKSYCLEFRFDEARVSVLRAAPPDLGLRN